MSRSLIPIGSITAKDPLSCHPRLGSAFQLLPIGNNAAYAGLPARAAQSVLADHARAEARALSLIEQSYLDDDRKRVYREMLTENTKLLSP